MATTSISPAPPSDSPPNREDEARQALEQTRIAPGVARALSLGFLLTIFAVPALHIAARARRGQAALPAPERGQATVPDAAELKRFEGALEEDSPVAQWVLPRAQAALARLGAGNSKALIGRRGWLLYKPDVDYLTGHGFLEAHAAPARDENGDEPAPRQASALDAIVRFRDQLQRRGIRLILLPTPLKPMLCPEALSPRYEPASAPLQNASYHQFLDELARRQVLVCDPTDALARSRAGGEPPFLRADTHWTPAAVRVAASELAGFIRRAAPLASRREAGWERRQVLASGRGDIAAMLKLEPGQAGLSLQQVALDQVTARGGGAWHSSSRSDVLLLGDSFTNIYSRAALGWGRGAGLAEQLSCELQRAVDVIAINAGGASSTRQALRDEMRRGHDRLAGKKLVVWQFAMRDLAQGDWKLLDLPASTASATATPSRPIVRTLPSVALRPYDPAVASRFRGELSKRAAAVEASRSEVMRGSGGWMFYLPDIYYVATSGFLGPRDSPQISALVNFKRQLERRGIALLVMPVPSKATIYTDKLGLGIPTPQAPQNPSFAPYCAALLRPRPRVAYTRRAAPVRNITDISMLLPRRPGNAQFVRVQQTVQRVLQPGGQPWRADARSDILVMGDSFVNIYSHGGYWGQGAGFTEQLSYYLQRPVDLIAMDRGGATRTRLALQREMKAGRDRLAGKKLVIYEFSSRYLLGRDWKIVALPRFKNKPALAPSLKYLSPPSQPRAPRPAPPIWVRATIRERSRVPAANSTPYADMVMQLRLSDARAVWPAGQKWLPRRDIVAYAWGLRNQLPTAAARWKAGQRVTLRLVPWAQAEEQFGSFDRTEVEGEEVSTLPAFWADVQR